MMDSLIQFLACLGFQESIICMSLQGRRYYMENLYVIVNN